MMNYGESIETIEREVRTFGFLTPSAHERLTVILSAAPEPALRERAGSLILGYDVLGGSQPIVH